MNNSDIKLFAGPDSLDDYNIDELYKIAEIKASGEPAIYGARTVGLKSRTNFDHKSLIRISMIEVAYQLRSC